MRSHICARFLRRTSNNHHARCRRYKSLVFQHRRVRKLRSAVARRRHLQFRIAAAAKRLLSAAYERRRLPERDNQAERNAAAAAAVGRRRAHERQLHSLQAARSRIHRQLPSEKQTSCKPFFFLQF